MALDDYPHPSVAVDTAVLTVDATNTLCVVLARTADGKLELPGTFLHLGELLTDAVLRSLQTKAGITGFAPRQLHVFDAPDRDERGWVLSVAHVDAVPHHGLMVDPALAVVVPVASVGRLPYDHNEILELALANLRTAYLDRPDPDLLLAEPFTLRQLHAVHEAVAGETLQRDTFRRAMAAGLTAVGELERGTVGKPAQLYRRGVA